MSEELKRGEIVMSLSQNTVGSFLEIIGDDILIQPIWNSIYSDVSNLQPIRFNKNRIKRYCKGDCMLFEDQFQNIPFKEGDVLKRPSLNKIYSVNKVKHNGVEQTYEVTLIYPYIQYITGYFTMKSYRKYLPGEDLEFDANFPKESAVNVITMWKESSEPFKVGDLITYSDSPYTMIAMVIKPNTMSNDLSYLILKDKDAPGRIGRVNVLSTMERDKYLLLEDMEIKAVIKGT